MRKPTLVVAMIVAAAVLAWCAVGDEPSCAGQEAETAPAPADPMPPPGVDLTVIDGETNAPLADVNVFFVAVGKDAPGELRDALQYENALAVAQGHGRVLTTDDAGRVRIPERAPHTLAAARSGALTGSVWLHSGMTTARLVLHRPASVRAIVEDPKGRPCAGVAVLLVSDTKYGRVPIGRARTDEDGNAVFPEITDRGPAAADDPLGVTVALALAAPPYARIDARALSGSPLRLVLPPTGSVRVELADEAGGAATGVGRVLLRVPRDGKQEYSVQDEGKFDDATATPHAGAALFAYVGLGVELEVEVPPSDEARGTRQRLRSPSKDGEEVTVRVTVGSARPVVVGRLVTAAGAAIADTELFADVVEPGHDSMDMGDCDMRCTSTTDADGRFRFALDRKPGATPSARLHIGRVFHGDKGSWGIRGIALVDLPRTLAAGDTNVGDVVYRGTEVLVAGVVVDPEGKPIEGVTVQAMKVSTSRKVKGSCTVDSIGSDGRSPDDEVDADRTDVQGRFELRGDRSSARISHGHDDVKGRVTLGAQIDGWFVADDATFDAGASDVRIVMQRAGGIAGSVVIPDGMDTYRIEVRIQGDAQRNGDIGYRFDLDDGLWALVRADGSFEVRNLRPGNARVVVRMGWNKSDEVLRLEDVVVTAGGITRDPRLQGFDPAAKRSKLTVSVVDIERQPLANAQVHFRAVDGDDLWTEATTGPDGRVVAPLKRLPAAIVVSCAGYRHAFVARASSDTTVVLEKGTLTVVRVRLADDVALFDPPEGLSARLHWVGASTGGDEAGGRHPLDVGTSSARFDKERVLTFETWNPGRYRVALMRWTALKGGGASGRDFPTFPEVFVTVPAEGGTVEVTVGDRTPRPR